MPVKKLEPMDFHEYKLCSVMLERDRAKMDILHLQVENSQLLFNLAQERAKYQSEALKAVEQKLVALQNRLREKYGVKNANEIDWETGEIKTEATQGAPPNAGNPGRGPIASPATPTASSTPNKG